MLRNPNSLFFAFVSTRFFISFSINRICMSFTFFCLSNSSQIQGDVAAGRPSNWEDQRRPSFAGRFVFVWFSSHSYHFLLEIYSLSFLSYQLVFFIAGRRSRRNSFSDDSQLTIENFGGSQDQLNMIGQPIERRFQDRERKISSASSVTIEPTLPARSSLADARGTIQIGYDSDGEKEDKETEIFFLSDFKSKIFIT